LVSIFVKLKLVICAPILELSGIGVFVWTTAPGLRSRAQGWRGKRMQPPSAIASNSPARFAWLQRTTERRLPVFFLLFTGSPRFLPRSRREIACVWRMARADAEAGFGPNNLDLMSGNE
jgi:hypothetical protein